MTGDSLFRWVRRPRNLIERLTSLTPEERRQFADEWDLSLQELEDWMERNPGGGVELSSVTAPALQPDQPGQAGTGTDAARFDHIHATDADAPLALAVGDTSDEGSALGSVLQRLRFARASHRHGLPTGTPVAVGTVNAPGVSTAVPRLDHVHAYTGAATAHGTVMSTVNQEIPINTHTVVKFNAIAELEGVTWVGAPDYKFVVVTAGLYRLGAQTKISSGANGYRHLHIFASGRRYVSDAHVAVDSVNGEATLHASAVVPLKVGDSFYAEVWHNDTIATINVVSGLADPFPYEATPVMSITRLGPVPVVPAASDWMYHDILGTTIRSDYTGELGCEFTVGDTPLIVSDLSRLRLGGPIVRTVRIRRKSDLVVVTAANVQLGTQPIGEFQWNATTAVPTPLTLTANTTYYLTSEETSGSSGWYDAYGPSHLRKVATLDYAAYRPAGGGAFTRGPVGMTYVPCSFRFTT